MLSNALHGQQQHQQQRRASVTSGSSSSAAAVGFTGALLIPGVIEFSLCLFFSKLVSYTFLYWLPLYIQSSSEWESLFILLSCIVRLQWLLSVCTLYSLIRCDRQR